MREPCGNTQAEIEYDEAQAKAEKHRENAEAMELLREDRANFIAKLLRNESVMVKDYSSGFRTGSIYTLADAIGEVRDETLWEHLLKGPEDLDFKTFAQAFEEDPELVCEMFVKGELAQFAILIRHEVECLADNVRF